MKIGVDTSLIVAAIHGSHPRHEPAASWVVRALEEHELVVAHHSVLEAFAVLTRLPGDLRVTPSEARDLLEASVRSIMTMAAFEPERIWAVVESLVLGSVVGGRSYDAFIARVLALSGAEAIATLNPAHFVGLVESLDVIDPVSGHGSAGD